MFCLFLLNRKLGWRLGLQSITGILSLAFFLPIVYRSANLYHPQRRAIMHLKNQRKKVKEKKTSNNKTKKPPMFDFSPLKSRGLRVLLVASASAALGVYAPIFYLVKLIIYFVSLLHQCFAGISGI